MKSLQRKADQEVSAPVQVLLILHADWQHGMRRQRGMIRHFEKTTFAEGGLEGLSGEGARAPQIEASPKALRGGDRHKYCSLIHGAAHVEITVAVQSDSSATRSGPGRGCGGGGIGF